MKRMKKNLMQGLLVFTFLCAFTFVKAQGGPGDPGPDPDGIPIDGGLSLVIAAAVGYAAKKGVDKRRKDAKAINDQEKAGDLK